MRGSGSGTWRVVLACLTLAGFALRAHDLAGVTFRWDEGWSVAMATLPVADVFRLTGQDVHPPLYYILLRGWMPLAGLSEFGVRYLSVLAGVAAVPLAAVAARTWAGARLRGGEPRGDLDGRRATAAGLAAATACTLAPALVYYAGVTRMYALTTPALLLAAWGIGRLCAPRAEQPESEADGAAATGSWRETQPPPTQPRSLLAATVAVVAGSLMALLTFYYSGFALAGLFLGALVVCRGKRAAFGILAAAGATALLYLPWLAFALPLMSGRLGAGTEEGLDTGPLPDLMREGLAAIVFAYRSTTLATGVLVLVMLVGLALAFRWLAPRALVAGLAILAAALGAAIGTQAHMFAPRYVIVGVPFLVLLLGWSAAALAPIGRSAPAIAMGAVALAWWPSLSAHVYLRDLEVTGAFDPSADHASLEPLGADDLVVFNILSLAGLYERYRGADDPSWTYAQLWDPVHEDLEMAKARISAAAADRDRLWFDLYKGTYSPDSAELKAWADRTFFPAQGWWAEDRLIQGYATGQPLEGDTPGSVFAGNVRLVRSALSDVGPDGSLALETRWLVRDRPERDAKLFVHVLDPSGELVAQSDGNLVADSRPPTTWEPGEVLVDRRALFLPEGVEGPLTVRVGFYDPNSGERWLIPGGDDSVALGPVAVEFR